MKANVRMCRLSFDRHSVAKQSFFYGCLLPGARRFLHSSSYRSKLVAKKHADSYPKIICVLIDVHGILLTEYLH